MMNNKIRKMTTKVISLLLIFSIISGSKISFYTKTVVADGIPNPWAVGTNLKVRMLDNFEQQPLGLATIWDATNTYISYTLGFRQVINIKQLGIFESYSLTRIDKRC